MKRFTYKKVIEDMSRAAVRRQQAAVLKAPLPAIELLDCIPADAGEVTYATSELTALCPMTGLPDFYTLTVTYTPGRTLPELKSLKQYLTAYRDLPILHEHLAGRVFDDFKRAVRPRALRVTLAAAIRGGIAATVVRESGRKR
ncbi:MAG: preQ(1) synthase [Planctomycetota bacterium]